VLPRDFLEQYKYELGFITLQTNREYSMSAIDRIKSKALQARGVVPRVIASVEADLDTVIAAEPDLEKQKNEAFAPHFSAIADTKIELAGIADALNLMSNGGPPLLDSGHVAPASNPGSTNPPLVEGATSSAPPSSHQ
jgi:hypothetical protein